MKQKILKYVPIILLACILVGVLSVLFVVIGNTPNNGQTTTTTTTTPNGPGGSNWQPPEDEYDIETPEGYNKLTFYWVGKNIDYSKCDIWIWYEDVNGQGYTVHECDYGVKVVVNIPEKVESVGFIVRKDCTDPGGSSWGNATKDGDNDRFAIITGKETYIFLKNGDTNQYSSNDGGKTLEVIKLFSLAGMKDFHTIRYNLTPKTTLKSYDDIEVWDGDKKLTVTNVSSMGKSASTGLITVEEELAIDKVYTVKIAGYEPCPVVPMEIFDSKEFADLYHYDGDDLGSYISADGKSTTFKVWAPTATKVVLDLYTQGHDVEAYKHVEMTRGEKGVWEHTEAGAGHGTYYTYTVTTSVGTQEATDPYGKAAGVNGNRTMVVDLEKTNPDGWDDTNFDSGIDSYSDAFIWEVHVRDFSNLIKNSQYKGKYLAFTEKGLVNEHGVPVGIDYLVQLGVTHVHLLPVYDYATVDEANPDSQFNWGYDPKNYNVPEGSYSTDPFNGEVRIKEYKAMVQALHDAGIGVIMDVVYNHTYDKNSSFNKIVPYYYYRYDKNTGANSSASGCGNDTASERYMYGKFMVESTSYWMEEYNLDGLRFDLMGLHDLETMKAVERGVHAINPNAIIYGEAWTMGSTINGSLQANQGNISKIPATNGAIGSVAVFNDAMRDGLKGSTFDGASQGYINGSVAPNTTKVKFGIQGGMVGGGTGWTVNNAMVINYMSCHDNYTLWDKFSMANGNSSLAERLRMNRLGAALLFISKGTPFVQAGEEMLRSKSYIDENGKLQYDHNSYNSSDEINNIRWDTLKPGSDEYNMMLYYKGLAEMRKKYSVLSDPSANMSITDLKNGAIAIHTKSSEGEALIIVNPSNMYGGQYTLQGTWKVVANGDKAGTATIETKSGDIAILGNMFLVMVR